jgi:DNA invertase Pin-like site-specific DNA recombinase
MKEKIDALKGRKVIVYLRVSTEEQTGTLPEQQKIVERGLKALGYKGTIQFFGEQASGTKIDRPELKKAIEEGMKKKTAVIVVRDIQRFTRDPYHLGVLYNPMRDNEVPIISINEPLVLGTKKVPNPASDLLAPILVAAGGSEVQTRLKQTLQGMKESEAKGIKAGTPINFFPKESLNPYRELKRLLDAGIGQSEGARRMGRSTSWFRKARDKIATMDEKKLSEWLNVIDMIRAMEKIYGTGLGKKAKKPMYVVRRMTSGYIFKPNDFDTPTQNDLDEYLKNWSEYMPKRSRK